MPVYEYEPLDRDCLMCPNRVRAVQPATAEPLTDCPWCGLEVRRVISSASFKIDRGVTPESRGFTTYRKSGEGVWEKTAGEAGADHLVASDEDKATIAAEKKPARVLKL